MFQNKVAATKIFTFDSAHMLAGHEGLCKNLHGHTYKVEVTVERIDGVVGLINHGPSEGMVLDFKDLKNACNSVFDKFDHAFIYNPNSKDSVELDIAGLLEINGRKVYAMDDRPTAENMALHFSREIPKAFKEYHIEYAECVKVKVWETPTSYAEV